MTLKHADAYVPVITVEIPNVMLQEPEELEELPEVGRIFCATRTTYLPELPRWIHSNEFTIKSNKSSRVYVVIGVMGTEQTLREYFIDSVCVTLTPEVRRDPSL